MCAKFKGAVKICKVCSAEYRVPPSRAETAEFCSITCASIGRGQRSRKRVSIICANCKQGFEAPAAHADRRVFCSYKCRNASATFKMSSADAVRREKNPMWSGGNVDHSDGYLYDYAADHPFASNGYVLSHRLVMERWLRLKDESSPFLIKLGNQWYLSPEFIVHHIDENKRNNSINNLSCLTAAEHTGLHSRARSQNRKD